MPLCYLITCHSSTEFVTDLIRYIHAPESVYLIHCDRKAPRELRGRVKALCQALGNVHELPSHPYSWAGYSQVAVVLEAIGDAMQLDVEWTHFIPVSEQCVPLRSQGEIDLRLQEGVSYISAVPAASMHTEAQCDLKSRFNTEYTELSGVGSFPTDLTSIDPTLWARLHHGTNWYVIARSACKRLLELSQDEMLVEPFRRSIHVDETMVQSLLLSDGFGPLLPVESVELTFQATPAVGGTRDTVFTDRLYWSAKRSDYLFIRKRPLHLSDSIKEDLEKLSNIPRDAFDCQSLLAEAPIGPAISLFTYVGGRLDEHGWNAKTTRFDPEQLPNVPRFYISVRTSAMSGEIDVRAVSEDLRVFKVLILAQSQFHGDYQPILVGDRAALLLRARVYDMFFAREVHLPEDDSRGFVARDALVPAVEWRLREAERLVRLSGR